MRRAGRACLLGLALFAAAAFSASASELHAIAIGFNQYQHVQKLQGAEADAGDIAAALRKRGVKDLVMMTDPRTSIADFKAAWTAMAARAAAGDMLMLSFAGHGIRTPETRIPKRMPDGYDKGFLFPTYDQVEHSEELLRDEDLYDLFKDTAAKGLHVLFVVDACHAGSGIRDVRPSGTVRFQRFDLKVAKEPPPTPLAVAPPPRPPIPSVAVITAQIKEKAIIEINVDGVSRGALSYAVARGLEGAADPEKSGVITVNKLWSYVRPIVRERSDNNQAPDLFDVASDGDMTILSAPDAAKPALARPAVPSDAPKPVAIPAGLPELKNVALFVQGGSLGAPPPGAALVADKAKADLIYDVQERQMRNATGDTIASNVEPPDLKGAIESRQLLNALLAVADRDVGLTIGLSGGDGIYAKGAEVLVRVDKLPYKYLTFLDLSANGRVEFLYPQPGDPLESDSDTPLPTIRVGEPYGADYLIAIRSEKPLRTLHDSFSKSEGGHYDLTAGATYEPLRQALSGVAVRVGIQGVYTCETKTGNEPCKSMAASSP